MKTSFTLDNGTLNLTNGLFTYSVADVTDAKASESDGNGLSMPFVAVDATVNGESRTYEIWDDLAALRIAPYETSRILTLAGEHWIARSVKLYAFTDDNDTMTDVRDQHMFARSLNRPCTGDIFCLEDPQTGNAIVILSEAPDYQTATLHVKNGDVSLENGKNPIVIGFCKMGECEAFCRNYYRHARKPKDLVTMSNTWGDRNGFTRVCQDFVLKEIDAARDIGVDIVQIDDGWQTGSTADPTIFDAERHRMFRGNFWDLAESRFPKGMPYITEYAAKDNIRVGLWFAPDSHGGFDQYDRDIAVLRKAYFEWGFRFFKLDMFWIQSDEERDNFLKMLREIYSFGDDVAVQLDVTRYARLNYLCGRQYGTAFIENRYTKSTNSFPHRILRNMWMLGHYIPTAKFQFELVNPDLNTDCYAEDDPFAPTLYSMDYLFATAMLSNPLFWMEMQFLPENRRKELAPLMKVWKEHRHDFARADVIPIGDKPNGRSFTGFYLTVDGKPAYMLLFREVTDTPNGIISANVPACDAEILMTNGDVQVSVDEGVVCMNFKEPRTYALVRLHK